MKQYEILKAAVIKWCADNKKKFSEESHFENGYGSKYIIAPDGTFGIKYADARCGNRLSIVKHGNDGTVSLVSGYLTPLKLIEWMLENKAQ